MILRTDYQPFRDFISVDVELEDERKDEFATDADRSFVDGRQVAFFEGLSKSDERAIKVSLIGFERQVIANQRVVISQHKDLVATVSITRNCENVRCDFEAAHCLAGSCVPLDCVTGDEPSCVLPPCATDEQCPLMGCAPGRCVDKVCFVDADASTLCDPGETCDLQDGCVPDESPCIGTADCDKTTACLSAMCLQNRCLYEYEAPGTACPGGVCVAGLCDVSENCFDMVVNQDEVDVDCGGTLCEGCDLGKTCGDDKDCKSDRCHNGTCVLSGVQTLIAGNIERQDAFGHAVSISGNRIAVASRQEQSCSDGLSVAGPDNDCDHAGAVYIFRRDELGWAQEAYIKAPNSDVGDWFGFSISLDGDTLLVGARDEDSCAKGIDGSLSNNSCSDAGAAYVYRLINNVWAYEAYLKASNTNANDRFGASVEIRGDRAIVGAPWEASCAKGIGGSQTNNSCTKAGAAYVFERTGSTWSQTAYLKATNNESYMFFGYSVAASQTFLVVGAVGDDSCSKGVDGSQSGSSTCDAAGAAHVFVQSAGDWKHDAYLKPNNSQKSDLFGWSVSASGNQIVVGAILEDGCGSGLGSDPDNNGCNDAGAAYSYRKVSGEWFFDSYLKAFNTSAGDQFGYAVSFRGTRLAVGARLEDGCSMSINGPVSDLCIDAGAAYTYLWSGGHWQQEHYVKSPNPVRRGFGDSIALDGERLVVGATGDSNCTGSLIGSGVQDRSCNISGRAYSWDALGSL